MDFCMVSDVMIFIGAIAEFLRDGFVGGENVYFLALRSEFAYERQKIRIAGKKYANRVFMAKFHSIHSDFYIEISFFPRKRFFCFGIIYDKSVLIP